MLICIFSSGALPSIDSDTAYQLRAVQQFHHGDSTSFYTLVMPDPADLTKDVSQWIVWWAPGNAFLVSSLMAAGFTLAKAVRILGVVCLLLGAIGWSMWMATFRLSRPLHLVLCAAWPWSIYAHNALFYYGAESLLFGTVPWSLLLLVEYGKFQGTPIRQCLLGTAAGLSLGLLYALKYTGAFLAVGAMMFIFTELIFLARRRALSIAAIVSVLVCAIACCAPVLAISITNSLRGGSMNLVAASRSFHFEWETLLFTLANPVLAAAGADHLLARLSSDVLALAPRVAGVMVGAAALPGAAALWFLLGRRLPVNPAGRLSCCILLASVACLVGIWTISWGASYEARHIAGAAMAFLPYAVEQASLLERRLLKSLMRLLAVIYIALPLLYGTAVFAVKLVRFARFHPGPSGLYNQYFSGRDAARARELLLQGFDPATDIWYVTHPLVAIDLPGRVVIRRIADMTVDELRKEVFHSRSRVRVRLVVPEVFATDGKANVIRQSFPHAVEWSLHPADPANPCWVSWIQPSSESELAAPRPVLAR